MEHYMGKGYEEYDRTYQYGYAEYIKRARFLALGKLEHFLGTAVVFFLLFAHDRIIITAYASL